MIHPIRTLDHIPNFVKTEFKICLQKNRRKLEAIIGYYLRTDRKVVVIEGRYRNLIIIKFASILLGREERVHAQAGKKKKESKIK